LENEKYNENKTYKQIFCIIARHSDGGCNPAVLGDHRLAEDSGDLVITELEITLETIWRDILSGTL